MKKKVLFVGDHPFATSGNAGMLHAVLCQVDQEKYDVSVFGLSNKGSSFLSSLKSENKDFPFPILEGSEERDRLGKGKLVEYLSNIPTDIVIFVGLDIWVYKDIFTQLHQLRTQKGFLIASIFPWDLQKVRNDWVNWINFFDFPCVYSEHGYNTLKDKVKNLKYYRPLLHYSDIWKPYSKEDKQLIKNRMFPGNKPEDLTFGFVGVNQHRKDPQRLLKAFTLAKKEVDNIVLYLHTNPTRGVYNLKQYAMDCGYEKGWLRCKGDGKDFKIGDMVNLYNAMDCLVNCSIQEGLSWTPLEAMLCGCPVIGSDTTAQTELIENSGVLVIPTVPTYQPLIAGEGSSWIDAMTCKAEDIAEAIVRVAKDKELREKMSVAGRQKGEDWLEHASNINVLLEDMFKAGTIEVKKEDKIDKVLFVQHSSAGDVLITTQCFKGIKERHKGKELVYMTQKQFKGVVEGNPYIDEIIDWDPKAPAKYSYIYNPHGEKILPGAWNNGDVKLYDMYPYFCKVEPDDLSITLNKPDIDLPEKYIVVNTAGASTYRRYAHSAIALKDIGYSIVQIGSGVDPYCEIADVDLRDRLSWTESAYIMKNAVCALVVDSYCAHLAGAVDTPAVVLFGPAPARVVGPRYKDKKNLIEMEPEKLKVCPISANCYGQPGREVCTSPCINTLNPMKVKQFLINLIERKG